MSNRSTVEGSPSRLGLTIHVGGRGAAPVLPAVVFELSGAPSPLVQSVAGLGLVLGLVLAWREWDLRHPDFGSPPSPPPTIEGRDLEVQELAQAFEANQTRCTVSGPRGVGTSTVVRAAIAQRSNQYAGVLTVDVRQLSGRKIRTLRARDVALPIARFWNPYFVTWRLLRRALGQRRLLIVLEGVDDARQLPDPAVFSGQWTIVVAGSLSNIANPLGGGVSVDVNPLPTATLLNILPMHRQLGLGDLVEKVCAGRPSLATVFAKGTYTVSDIVGGFNQVISADSVVRSGIGVPPVVEDFCGEDKVYELLGRRARRLFRLMALLPTGGVPASSASTSALTPLGLAELSGIPPRAIPGTVRELLRAHLIDRIDVPVSSLARAAGHTNAQEVRLHLSERVRLLARLHLHNDEDARRCEVALQRLDGFRTKERSGLLGELADQATGHALALFDQDRVGGAAQWFKDYRDVLEGHLRARSAAGRRERYAHYRIAVAFATWCAHNQDNESWDKSIEAVGDLRSQAPIWWHRKRYKLWELNQSGVLACREGNVDEAIRLHRESLSQNRKSHRAQAHINLGLAILVRGGSIAEVNEAIKHFGLARDGLQKLRVFRGRARARKWYLLALAELNLGAAHLEVVGLLLGMGEALDQSRLDEAKTNLELAARYFDMLRSPTAGPAVVGAEAGRVAVAANRVLVDTYERAFVRVEAGLSDLRAEAGLGRLRAEAGPRELQEAFKDLRGHARAAALLNMGVALVERNLWATSVDRDEVETAALLLEGSRDGWPGPEGKGHGRASLALGVAHWLLGEPDDAADRFRDAAEWCQSAQDLGGQEAVSGWQAVVARE